MVSRRRRPLDLAASVQHPSWTLEGLAVLGAGNSAKRGSGMAQRVGIVGGGIMGSAIGYVVVLRLPASLTIVEQNEGRKTGRGFFEYAKATQG